MAYTPPNALTLNKIAQPQIRLGIQGYPGTGKTWAALTFPNAIVLDIDRGLGAHVGRTDVMCLPFYDPEFVKTIIPAQPYNIKDALSKWIDTEGRKLDPEQFLVIDCLTAIESNYHTMWRKHPTRTKQGNVDDRDEWTLKNTYFGELFDTMLSLRCNIIVLTHEQDAKNKLGEYTGKTRPLMTGQFADKIVGKFTDWFRQQAADKPKADLAPDKLALWGMNSMKEFNELAATYPRNTMYFWQLESDDMFDGKASSLVNFPRYIPANYNAFKKWMRK